MESAGMALEQTLVPPQHWALPFVFGTPRKTMQRPYKATFARWTSGSLSFDVI